MAANPESLVALGKGGTGAAAILTQDTAPDKYFETVDKLNAPKKDKFLDDLGNEITKGINAIGILDRDKEDINNLINQTKQAGAKLYYDRTTYASNPKAWQDYDNLRRLTQNAISRSQMDNKLYHQAYPELVRNGHKYDRDKTKATYDNYFNTPLFERNAVPTPVMSDVNNYGKIFDTYGGDYIKRKGSKYIKPDGSFAYYNNDTFDEQSAREGWNDIVNREYNTQQMNDILAHANDEAEKAYEATKAPDAPSWNELPEDQRLPIIDKVAEDWYVEDRRNKAREKNASNIKATPDAAKGGRSNPKDNYSHRVEFAIKGDSLVPTEVFDIFPDKEESSTKSDKWVVGNEVIVGSPNRVIQQDGKPAMIEIIKTLPDQTTTLRLVPYANNKEKLTKKYGDPYSVRPKNYQELLENPPASNEQSLTPDSPEEDKQKARQRYQSALQNYKNKKSGVKTEAKKENKWVSKYGRK